MRKSHAVSAKKSDSDALQRECSKCGYALYPNTGRCTNHECPKHRREGGVMTAAELVFEYAPPPLYHGRKWGDWTLDTERLCLDFEAHPVMRGEGPDQYLAYIGHYEIDLERVRDSAAALDWIFQILGKNWATQRVMKDLLNAIDDIIHPQANLCSGACGSGGGGKVIKDPSAFLRGRISTVGKSTRVAGGAA